MTQQFSSRPTCFQKISKDFQVSYRNGPTRVVRDLHCCLFIILQKQRCKISYHLRFILNIVNSVKTCCNDKLRKETINNEPANAKFQKKILGAEIIIQGINNPQCIKISIEKNKNDTRKILIFFQHLFFKTRACLLLNWIIAIVSSRIIQS